MINVNANQIKSNQIKSNQIKSNPNFQGCKRKMNTKIRLCVKSKRGGKIKKEKMLRHIPT